MTLPPGTKVGLTDKQARGRGKQIAPAGKGAYKIIGPRMQVKSGDVIGLTEVPKKLKAFLEEVKTPEAEKGPDPFGSQSKG